MTASTASWVEDAFFDDPDGDPIDGGDTSHGSLWHAVSPRWGHSMHSMCSYHGMFPAKMAHYFIERYSNEGDLVFDPFSGRGTTPLQARVEGRRAVANDLSPLAYVLSRAKTAPAPWAAVLRELEELERTYKRSAVTVDVHPDIKMLYHEKTLSQLVYLRNHLFRRSLSKWSRVDYMIAGATAGILHGNHRRDGTSQYLSISMPNTFSMSPGYVEKFIRDNNLERIDQNVFDRLRDKVARLYLDGLDGPAGSVSNRDANALMASRAIKPRSVDLLLTSPPYLDVVNYGTSNWIRLWWLGLDDVARESGAGRRRLNAKLDHRHNYDSYVDFMRRTFKGARRVLSKTGVAVFVIGDVAAPGREARPIAQDVWDAVGQDTGLILIDMIEDTFSGQSKVSRIWGDTKGNATDRDCVLVLARDDGAPRTDIADVQWFEPYKDAGPDAAHARLRKG